MEALIFQPRDAGASLQDFSHKACELIILRSSQSALTGTYIQHRHRVGVRLHLDQDEMQDGHCGQSVWILVLGDVYDRYDRVEVGSEKCSDAWRKPECPSFNRILGEL
jgi:hypothetical protein